MKKKLAKAAQQPAPDQSQAISIIRRFFSDKSEILNPESGLDVTSVYRGRLAALFQWGSGAIGHGDTLGSHCERIVRCANAGDRHARIACLEAAAEFLNAGRELPTPLKSFAVEYLRSAARTHSGNGRRGRNGRDNLLRDLTIAEAVECLSCDFGISPTRNEASSHDSGCSIVAQLVREYGLNLSERNVERIWNRCKGNGPEVQLW